MSINKFGLDLFRKGRCTKYGLCKLAIDQLKCFSHVQENEHKHIYATLITARCHSELIKKGCTKHIGILITHFNSLQPYKYGNVSKLDIRK